MKNMHSAVCQHTTSPLLTNYYKQCIFNNNYLNVDQTTALIKNNTIVFKVCHWAIIYLQNINQPTKKPTKMLVTSQFVN